MNTQPTHPTAVPSKRKYYKKKIAILVCVIAALLLAGGGSVWWFYVKKTPNTAVDDQTVDAIAFQPRTEAEDKADALRWELLQNPSDEAVAEAGRQLEALLEAAETDEDRRAYMLELIAIYRDAGYSDSALDCAQRLEQSQTSDMSARIVADIYFDMENYSEAVHYYQLAANRTEVTDDPTKSTPYNDYMIKKRKAEALL